MRAAETFSDSEIADLLEREQREREREPVHTPALREVSAPREATPPRERLIPIAAAVLRLGKHSRSVIYSHFASGTLTKHIVGGRVHVDEEELDALMLEPAREAPRTRAAPLPLTLRDSVPHASRALRVTDDRHRQRMEHLLEDVVEELQALRATLSVSQRRAWP